ncbi:hypothetical protein K469DRAFT_550636, partial [Zopfia rhizophila CBS 207.26]
KKNLNVLPPHYKGINYNIKLIAKNTLILSLLYSISFNPPAGGITRILIKKLIKRIYINKLKQDGITNAFYTKKKNRKLKLYINYRYFNKAIVKNHYLILLISKLINKLRGVKWFSLFNIKNKYY